MLLAWNRGEPDALDALLPLVYEELRRQAARYMKRERVGHMLQATALVNEVYLRLIDVQNVQWQNRAHFFAMAARLMRRILVDAARSKGYQKRGGGAPMLALEEALVVPKSGGRDAIFRRAQSRRDGRGAARLARYDQARLEDGEAVAAAGTASRRA